MKEIKITTISVKPETKALLEMLGHKGESFDDILNRLGNKALREMLDERWNRILKSDKFIPLDEL
jgi:hypothetical protein